MDEAKTQVLWDPEHSKKVLNSQLRFPKPETIASAKIVTEPASAPVEQPVPAPSVLNVDAPEFVPKFIQAPIEDVELQLQHTHISGKPSAQNRLRKIKNSHNNTVEVSVLVLILFWVVNNFFFNSQVKQAAVARVRTMVILLT